MTVHAIASPTHRIIIKDAWLRSCGRMEYSGQVLGARLSTSAVQNGSAMGLYFHLGPNWSEFEADLASVEIIGGGK